MDEQILLISEIENYCHETGIAESTFGRQVVNDGKFVGRLREGKGVTTSTVSKVRKYITARGIDQNSPKKEAQEEAISGSNAIAGKTDIITSAKNTKREELKKSAFRFYDNRQKYLMFVNTCSEKWIVAERVGMELAHIHPTPPALRVFDAGMGDGTVLTSVMRGMHRRYKNMPFFIVGKEISLEDVRLSLEKMSDRFFEHPATVLIVTNLYYTESPWLTPQSMQAAAALNWMDVPLAGDTAHDFHEQIKDSNPF